MILQSLFLLFLSLLCFGMLKAEAQKDTTFTNYSKTAQDFLYAVKTEDSTRQYLHLLAQANPQEIHNQLDTDDKRLAFWLNLYNAFVQMRLHQSPELFKHRGKFYKKKDYLVAGKSLSLDYIEHGILRRSKNKLSMGYLNKWFPDSFERKMRVRKLDSRIHFALNCGASSCPPIRFYEAEKINRQLDLASKIYLQGEVKYDEAANKIYLPKLFSWFRGDFGGKKGIKRFLKKYALLPTDSNPKLVFKKYNWDLALKKFETP
jgi:hypothetical protein